MIPTVKTALNADVVGYSRLMADDFEATKRVMDDYERLVSSHVTDNQGLLVNFVGDNFMALFDDPAAAMKAAISISAEIESRNSGLASIRQVRFRMGLDLGPASQSGNQWFGDALNIAARIQAIASEGGVSVSGEVYRGLDEPELRFTSRGRKQLKNILNRSKCLSTRACLAPPRVDKRPQESPWRIRQSPSCQSIPNWSMKISLLWLRSFETNCCTG